ncbi:MAG: hypothetical protein K8R36_24450 [Planctomycetales bacterium]|nr:hypothetical protein [Planctomycetales bacterium]
MTYHITGLISAAIFLLTISGLWAQLKFVRKRRQKFTLEGEFAERPTAVISVNQFVSSFLAFFSFFLYGACLERFDHYLVWPRLAASILTLVVLFDILRDRRDVVSSFAFAGCTLLLAGASLLLITMPAAVAWVRTFSQGLILVATVIMAQGYLHQVVLIRQTGTTGGVSARLHQFFFLKDVSTIAFSLAMGVSTGWPVLLLSSVSAATKLITLWHVRWARLSPLARQRREAAGPNSSNDPQLAG